MLKAYKSPLFRQYLREGLIEARQADVAKPAELARIARYAANASRVWVIDARGQPGPNAAPVCVVHAASHCRCVPASAQDGDHFATPLLVHFHLLARFVTPGGASAWTERGRAERARTHILRVNACSRAHPRQVCT